MSDPSKNEIANASYRRDVHYAVLTECANLGDSAPDCFNGLGAFSGLGVFEMRLINMLSLMCADLRIIGEILEEKVGKR